MRVAFPIGGTDSGRSGLGTYVRGVLPALRTALEGRGDSIVVLGSHAEIDAYGETARDTDFAITPSLFDPPFLSAIYYQVEAGRAALRAGADVVLFPAANRRFSRVLPLPAVGVVHDLGQLHVPDKYDALRMAYFRHVLLGALRSATELVAISTATRNDLVKTLKIPTSRIRIVPNGVDAARFAPPKTGDERVARARAHTKLARPYVLYPSRLEHPAKNHLRLLRAFAASTLRQTHVLALAGADWGAEESIRREIARLDLADEVSLLGYLPEEIMPGLVAGADAVVMVGLTEGFGLPALEALAAGRAVCAADAAALPEVVGPLAALCNPLEERSITRALERAAHDSALRARCALEGPEWAARRSWGKTAGALLQACDAALVPDSSGVPPAEPTREPGGMALS